jgi:large subunit ribosomal protein L1
MAKKQPDKAADTPETTAAAPETSEKKEAPAKGAGKQARGKPDAPVPAAEGGESPEKKEAARPAKAKPSAPAAAGEPAKKKSRRPGSSPRRGKKLRENRKKMLAKIAKETPATLARAIELLKQAKRSKFDEAVEVHMSLGIDATQSDQMIRGSVGLPHGLGKSKRVVVFCQGDNVAKALEAGADFAGGDDLVEKIQKQNWLDFDVALATQDMMAKASRLGKVLGPRGLMPSPKAGTVLTAGQDVGQAVREQKAGKVEYRSDKSGNVHAGVGKISFEDDKLVGNITAFVDQVRAVKPAGVKGNYIRSITISSTMGPGIQVAM